MNDFEAAARGQRASLASEFITPILTDVRQSYMTRMAEIASTELDAKARTEKITALSIALKILGNIDAGLAAAVKDGELGERNIIRSENVEKMGREKRRLFDMVPQR